MTHIACWTVMRIFSSVLVLELRVFWFVTLFCVRTSLEWNYVILNKHVRVSEDHDHIVHCRQLCYDVSSEATLKALAQWCERIARIENVPPENVATSLGHKFVLVGVNDHGSSFVIDSIHVSLILCNRPLGWTQI